MNIKMDKIPIALIVVIVVLAFVSGYFIGLLNSAGNFTLNITNKTNDTGTDFDKGYDYKKTYTPITYNKTPINTPTNKSSDKPDPDPPVNKSGET